MYKYANPTEVAVKQRKNDMNKLLAAVFFLAFSSSAFAQADTCAAYLKQMEEMNAAMKSAGQAMPPTDPSDAAIESYCKANPKAPLAEAMQKALKK